MADTQITTRFINYSWGYIMKFKEFLNESLNESYEIHDDPNVVNQLTKEVYILNHINNDFKYLHLNSNGVNFEILHHRFNDYYYNLSNSIDYILEIIASYNAGSKECCPVNFNNELTQKGQNNTLNIPHSTKECLESYQAIVEEGLRLLNDTIKSLTNVRKAIKGNEALESRLDDFGSYWQKEYTYLFRRFKDFNFKD